MIEIENEKYFTVKELADILQCSTKTIRRYIQAGKLDGKKITSKLYITEKSMLEYIKNSK